MAKDIDSQGDVGCVAEEEAGSRKVREQKVFFSFNLKVQQKLTLGMQRRREREREEGEAEILLEGSEEGRKIA